MLTQTHKERSAKCERANELAKWSLANGQTNNTANNHRLNELNGRGSIRVNAIQCETERRLGKSEFSLERELSGGQTNGRRFGFDPFNWNAARLLSGALVMTRALGAGDSNGSSEHLGRC